MPGFSASKLSMKTTIAIPLLSLALALAGAGCGNNPCKDVVDAIAKAQKVPGCAAYLQQFVDSTMSIDTNTCNVGDQQAAQYEAEATCLDEVTSCDTAGKTKLGLCIERAFSR